MADGHLIADRYGSESVSFAAQMAHSFETGGKTDAQKAWLSIMERIHTLTSLENSAGTTPQ